MAFTKSKLGLSLLALTFACSEESTQGGMVPETRDAETSAMGMDARADRSDTGPADTGEMIGPDAGETVMDAGRPADAGTMPVIDAGEFMPDARVRPDLGFPARDAGLPRFDGSLPRFDGSLPSFDGSLPSFDAGMAQTSVSISSSMPTEIWLNLMPIVSPDPIRASVTLDYDNSGTADDLVSVDQATLLIVVQNAGSPSIPRLFTQTFVLGPDYLAPPGQTTKTLSKVLGSAMPQMVMMPQDLCNQRFILTLQMSNGQSTLAQGMTNCVF